MPNSRALTLGLVLGWLPVFATAQTTNPYFTNQTIQQVSLDREAASEPRAERPIEKEQLAISIRYLLLDDETRQTIYDWIDTESVQHGSHHTPAESRLDLHSISAGSQVRTHATTHGHAASCRLPSELADQILALVAESPHCKSSQAPAVILQQNQIAEVRDLVQRPMVMDVASDGDSVKPEVEHVESGIQVRLLARLTSANSIDFKVHVIDQAIVAERAVNVLGVRHGPTTLQSPVTVETSVTVSQAMSIGEQLLVDPHVRRRAEVEVPSDSMFGKLPIVLPSVLSTVGKRFAKPTTRSMDANLIVLIAPAILAGVE